MPDRRLPFDEPPPAYEDAGLFKKGIVKVPIALVPQMQRNLRQDLLVHGVFEKTHDVTVVFAGRRMRQAEPIRLQLERLRAQARVAAAGPSEPTRTLDDFKLPTMIEGAWRVMFDRDLEGWETRSYLLMASRWSFRSADGVANYCGQPAVLPSGKK